MNITKQQLNKLEELSKQAAKISSMSLSKLINMPVKLEVTQVRFIKTKEFSATLLSPEKQVVAILLPVTGECSGESALILSIEESYKFVEIIMKQPKDMITKIDEISISALKEIANIIGGSFLSSIANTTGISLVQSVPKFMLSTMNNVASIIIEQFNLKKNFVPFAFEIDFALHITTITTTITYLFLLDVSSSQKFFEEFNSQQS